MIGRRGERGSGISVLAARHDDDDDDPKLMVQINMKYLDDHEIKLLVNHAQSPGLVSLKIIEPF